MFKKLKPGETEDDVLRMAAEFNAEREKNPNFQPAATVVRVEKRKCCHIKSHILIVLKYYIFEFNKSSYKVFICTKTRESQASK